MSVVWSSTIDWRDICLKPKLEGTKSVTSALRKAVHCNSFCSWSARTIVPVENCPKNEKSTSIRAHIKACERLADVQNCTTPSKFKYHCLSTQTPGILVEICAAEMDINGVCMIYNTALGRLQTYDNVNCKDIIPKCPDNYLSTVAHLYAPCYQFVDIFNFTRGNKRNRTIVGEKEKITFHGITYLAIGITGIVMFGTLVIGMIILRTVKHRGRGKRKWRRNKS
ncbi:uncharacterized protein LOC134256411, partial [Saccostrea cucullata]|uniref:uncharacterized protein LOC134256411 n=1 Tax=Saccostrea cuccullata TaxID=36930 RepID=UPI002ED5498E